MNAKILSYLKGVPLTVYLIAGALAVAGSWLAINNAHQRQIGKRDIQIHQYEVANADLRRVQDSLKAAYRVDTIRFTKYRTLFDTLAVNVDRWKHDTIQVVQFVAKADTAIKACSQALSTCEARLLIAQHGWDSSRDELSVLKKQMPSRARYWIYGSAGVVVGALAARTLIR